jgi:HSP20 family protein
MMLTSPVFGLRREIDRLFEDAFGGGGMSGAGGMEGRGSGALIPAVDVREDEHALMLEFEMPGIRPDDVQITAENGVLTVRAEKQDERTRRENERHHIVERSYGTFVRSIQLPQGIDEEQIEADFEHGVLRVRVPKAARPQPRRIQVRAGGGASGKREVGSGASGSGATGSGSAGSSRGASGGAAGGGPANGGAGNGGSGDPMQNAMNSTGSAGTSGQEGARPKSGGTRR